MPDPQQYTYPFILRGQRRKKNVLNVGVKLQHVSSTPLHHFGCFTPRRLQGAKLILKSNNDHNNIIYKLSVVSVRRTYSFNV